MKTFKKLMSYLPLFFALWFGVSATMYLINGALGPGLMNLIFAMYFMFDYKTDRLSQRVRNLEVIEAMRMHATMEMVNNAYEQQEPPTGTPQ